MAARLLAPLLLVERWSMAWRSILHIMPFLLYIQDIEYTIIYHFPALFASQLQYWLRPLANRSTRWPIELTWGKPAKSMLPVQWEYFATCDDLLPKISPIRIRLLIDDHAQILQWVPPGGNRVVSWIDASFLSTPRIVTVVNMGEQSDRSINA